MLDEGWSYGRIAEHYNVHRHVLRSKLQQLRKRELIHYENRSPRYDDHKAQEEEIRASSGFKETVEILPDGTHKSDKLLRMSAEQTKDVNYLLEAHGYDKKAWELVSARSNIWNAYSKQDGIMTLYASKITVKPRVSGWSFDELLAAVREVAPAVVKQDVAFPRDHCMLEIPLYDAHFGISDYDHYKPTQARIQAIMNAREWQQVLFIVGQDVFHNDNFRGTTSNGTQIEYVDIPRAWADCRRFYEPLIEDALKHSATVKVIYSKGNHDEALGWAFVQFIKARFPQVNVDDTVVERKVHTFHSNFIGITHGDKARKELQSLFPAEFPLEWSRTVNREIHTGHLHYEEVKDGHGIMFRMLSTRNKTDKWHTDNGFTGKHKRFQLFEWSSEALERIHYV